MCPDREPTQPPSLLAISLILRRLLIDESASVPSIAAAIPAPSFKREQEVTDVRKVAYSMVT